MRRLGRRRRRRYRSGCPCFAPFWCNRCLPRPRTRSSWRGSSARRPKTKLKSDHKDILSPQFRNQQREHRDQGFLGSSGARSRHRSGRIGRMGWKHQWRRKLDQPWQERASKPSKVDYIFGLLALFYLLVAFWDHLESSIISFSVSLVISALFVITKI